MKLNVYLAYSVPQGKKPKQCFTTHYNNWLFYTDLYWSRFRKGIER